MAFETSCHCGKVKATIEGEMPTEAMSCNCSICRRKGHLLHFVAADRAEVKAEPDAVSDYTFNRHAIHHQFCATCGCNPFGHGADGEGNEMVAVNMRCVMECDLDALKINKVDGASF